MRVCLMIEGQEGVTWDDWVRARDARGGRTGLDGLFRSDHYTRDRPTASRRARRVGDARRARAVMTDGSGSARSSRPRRSAIRACSRAWPSTVDHISGGRVELGMGAGWYEREQLENGFPFLDAKARFELFAEQVEIVVRSWTEEGFDHDGPAYALRNQTALPKPVQQPHPPLVLGGASGRVCGARCPLSRPRYDTLGATIDELRARQERLDEACAAIGRDPATLRFS